jgi:competence protein ComGC
MKPRFSNQRTAALTLVEVLVVIATLAVFVLLIVPAIGTRNYRSKRMMCVSNLRQIGIAYTVWADDNGGKYPRQVSLTNGGAMELIATGNVVACFQVMSNQLPTPKILLCPADTKHMAATDFASGLAGSNISYFVGLDAAPYQPQAILSGDDDLELGGIPVKSGLLELSTDAPASWSAARHEVRGIEMGNIGLADGSVLQTTISGFTNRLQQTGLAVNRLAIP